MTLRPMRLHAPVPGAVDLSRGGGIVPLPDANPRFNEGPGQVGLTWISP